MLKQYKSRMIKLLFLKILIYFVMLSSSFGAPKAELWEKWTRHHPESSEKIDHSQWDQFLKKHLIVDHASGVNRVNYGQVSSTEQKRLRSYIHSLEQTPISQYNRDEQQAFWINLYNAVTVLLIIEKYPVDSIKKINISPGWFSFGPWDARLAQVEEQELTLNDIEHRILRPIWRDNRVHYAVNCASIGCPNLASQAYTAENTEFLLEQGAIEYVNHPRGVTLEQGELQISSIYKWYMDDFQGSKKGIKKHLLHYAKPTLRKQLQEFEGDWDFDYDWNLNQP